MCMCMQLEAAVAGGGRGVHGNAMRLAACMACLAQLSTAQHSSTDRGRVEAGCCCCVGLMGLLGGH